MDRRLRTAAKWTLRLLATLAVLASLATVPTIREMLTAQIKAGGSGFGYEESVPYLVQWEFGTPPVVYLTLSSALCVMLFVFGGWPTRALAVIGAVWFNAIGWVLQPGFSLMVGLRLSDSALYQVLAAGLSGLLLLSLSVVAFVLAYRLGRSPQDPAACETSV